MTGGRKVAKICVVVGTICEHALILVAGLVIWTLCVRVTLVDRAQSGRGPGVAAEFGFH